MSVLVSLPDDLCREILSDWLRITSWGKLDKAFCSSVRNAFLNVLGGACVSADEYNSDSFVNWVRDRGVTLNEISLRPNMFTVDSNGLSWKLPHDNILSIKIVYETDHVVDAVNTCANLTSLSCPIDINFTALKVLDRLSHLKIHRTKGEIPFIGGGVWAIIKQCRRLRTFHCPVMTLGVQNRRLISKIIENNFGLEDIDCSANKQQLLLLVRQCYRTLRVLKIDGDFDFEAVTTLFRDCPHLEEVALEGKWVSVEYEKMDSLSIDCEMIRSEPGMSELMSVIPKVSYLRLHYDCDWDDDVLIYMANNIGSGLTDVDFWCEDVSSSALQYMFEHCPLLRCFAFRGSFNCNWMEAFRGNILEKVSICGGNDCVLAVLKSCQHLSHVSYFAVSINTKLLVQLIPAIKNYRNVDGQSVKTDSNTFWFAKSDGTVEFDLEYDGVNFSGELWEEYQGIFDGQAQLAGLGGADSLFLVESKNAIIDAQALEISELKAVVARYKALFGDI